MIAFIATILGAGIAIPLLCVIGHAISVNARQWRPGELMTWPEENH